MHEAGSRETALVTAGKVRLVVGEAHYDLHDGDSVTFDADLPHHFENPTDTGEARFLSVVSAGLRRS
jgi:quercetin dioxygenase-like cupin family protein